MKYPFALPCLILAVITAPLAAQLPDSPTGRGGNAVIQMFKDGPSSVTESYMEEKFSQGFLAATSLAERQEWLSQVVDRIGTLELRGVEKTGQFEASISGLSSKTGGKDEVTLEMYSFVRDQAFERRDEKAARVLYDLADAATWKEREWEGALR